MPPVEPWVQRARRDTPASARIAHLNSAGSALPPQPVLDTVISHLRREAEIGGYEAADEAAERTAAVYRSVAALLGARVEEVALVESATQAWDLAVHGFAFRAGDRVLTSRAEYSSNAVALLQLQARHGIEVVLLDDDVHGQVDLQHLEAELQRGAAMVALTHVPTNGGLVNPAADVGAQCRRHGTLFVLDACQSAGQLPLDVGELGCDVLTATGRKFLRGPRGTGLLYVRGEALARFTPPMLDTHGADWVEPGRYAMRTGTRRFEQFEHAVAGRLGLGAAIDYARTIGVARIAERNGALAERLRGQLHGLDRVSVLDKGLRRSAIVTFRVDGRSSSEVHAALRAADVHTSVTVAAHARFDFPERGIVDAVRASVHYFNTEDELDRLVEVVATG